MVAPAAASAAWSAPVSISPAGQSLYGSSIDATTGPDGTIFAIWDKALGSQNTLPVSIQLAKITPAGNVGAPIAITGSLPTPAAWRDSAVGLDGSVVASWVTSYDGQTSSVQAVRVAPDGTVGAVRTLYNGSTAPTSTTVVVDNNGQTTVVWERESDSSPHEAHIVQAARMQSNGTTTPPQTLGSGFAPYPSAAIQPSGRVLVTWSGSRFTTLSADGNQGVVVDLDPGHGTYSGDALKLGSNGEGSVTWSRNPSLAVMSRRVRLDGTLGPILQLSPDGQPVGSGASVGVSSIGVTTAFWTVGDELWTAQTSGDAVASPPRSIGELADAHGGYAVAVDVAGVSTLTWIDEAGSFDSADWRVRGITVPRNGTPQPSTIISGSDEPRGTTATLVDGAGTVTALWQTFPGGMHPVARMARMGLSTPAPSSCPAVQLLGVAGSGETGLGPTVKAFSDALHTRVQARAASAAPPISLDYPAVSVTPDISKIFNDFPGQFDRARTAVQAFLRDPNGKYMRSVRSGVQGLVTRLGEELRKRCVVKGTTKFVLAGYSQGAHVVGDALEKLSSSLRPRIAQVVLFADPRFPGGQSIGGTQLRSSFLANQVGVLGARKPPSSDYHSYSFCRGRDAICQGVGYLPDLAPHSSYVGFEALWAANIVATATAPLPLQRPLVTKLVSTLTPDGRSLRVSCKMASPGTCYVQARSTTGLLWNLFGIGNPPISVLGFPDAPPFVSAQPVTIKLSAWSSAGGYSEGQVTTSITCRGTSLGERICST